MIDVSRSMLHLSMQEDSEKEASHDIILLHRSESEEIEHNQRNNQTREFLSVCT